jgi:hypothetical protein
MPSSREPLAKRSRAACTALDRLCEQHAFGMTPQARLAMTGLIPARREIDSLTTPHPGPPHAVPQGGGEGAENSAFFPSPFVGRVGVGDRRCVNVKADWYKFVAKATNR